MANQQNKCDNTMITASSLASANAKGIFKIGDAIQINSITIKLNPQKLYQQIKNGEVAILSPLALRKLRLLCSSTCKSYKRTSSYYLYFVRFCLLCLIFMCPRFRLYKIPFRTTHQSDHSRLIQFYYLFFLQAK